MRENTPPHSSHDSVDEEEFNDELEEIELDNENQQFSDDGGDFDSEPESEEDCEGDGLRIPERDDAQLTFEKHVDPVFSCALHPKENIAVTGGQDDKAYVWNIDTGEIVFEVNDHKDTVIAVDFSYDGNYLATGDMSGEIFVYAVQRRYQKVWEYSMGDMCWMKWHTAACVLMAGSDAGEIYVWRPTSNDCKILPGAGQICESGELTKDGKHIFAGYADGSIKLWDIKNCTTVFKTDPSHPISHKSAVTTVSCDSERSLFISGSEDGTIVLSTHNGPMGVINLEAGPIERVAICLESNLNIAAAATLHGSIFIIDTSKQSIRARCNHVEDEEKKDGVASMKWIPNQTLLCGTMDGHLMLFNGRNGERIRYLDGHAAHIYDMAYDKTKNILLTVSEDGRAKIFKCVQ